MTQEEAQEIAREREGKCFHEVGHLVYGLLHGQVANKVVISPYPNESGVGWNSTVFQSQEESILEGLAGPATEARYCYLSRIKLITNALREHRFPRDNNESMSIDFARCADLSDDALADLIESTFTENYFAENHNLILAFARELLKKDYLEAEEIKSIYEKEKNRRATCSARA